LPAPLENDRCSRRAARARARTPRRQASANRPTRRPGRARPLGRTLTPAAGSCCALDDPWRQAAPAPVIRLYRRGRQYKSSRAPDAQAVFGRRGRDRLGMSDAGATHLPVRVRHPASAACVPGPADRQADRHARDAAARSASWPDPGSGYPRPGNRRKCPPGRLHGQQARRPSQVHERPPTSPGPPMRREDGRCRWRAAHSNAGCCWVRQWMVPSPHTTSTQSRPTTRRPGRARSSVASARRSLRRSRKVGTSSAPLTKRKLT